MKVALSIAGSDPTGGAGIQADLQVFRAHGVHGAAVITALTVQDTERVHSVLQAFPSVVLDQLRVLLDDFAPDAIKIGALVSDDVVRNVTLGLARLPISPAARVPIVIDPVLAASDGTPLLERRAWGALQNLISLAALVTPNLDEAAALSGCDTSTEEGTQAAACSFVTDFGAQAALVKGGHRDGPPRDLLAIREGGSVALNWLDGERIAGGPVHGTGCALSSAITAHLAMGVPMIDAVSRGRKFVADALRNAEARGKRARFLSYGVQVAPS
jgi:hydroxymethylpyrimidine kinase/phosphomethylpyrimidine kinase